MIKSQSGSALIFMLLTVLAVANISLMLILNSPKSSLKETNRLNMMNSLSAHLSMIKGHIEHPIAWSQTYNHASNINLKNCSEDSGFACPTGEEPLALYNAAGELVYDSSDPNAGISRTGEACDDYGTSPCIYKLNLTWSVDCPTICFPRKIFVRGELTFDPSISDVFVFNSAKHFTFTREVN